MQAPAIWTEVYFIRHGIAVERGRELNDEARALTPKGRAKTQRIAQRLVEFGLSFDILLASPLVRAWQTAEILQAAGLGTALEAHAPLRPGGELVDWLTWLATWQQSQTATAPGSEQNGAIALIGHEPTLSQWAQQLVTGQRAAQGSDRPWILKKAGVIGLKVPAARPAIGRCQLFWLAPPRFLL